MKIIDGNEKHFDKSITPRKSGDLMTASHLSDEREQGQRLSTDSDFSLSTTLPFSAHSSLCLFNYGAILYDHLLSELLPPAQLNWLTETQIRRLSYPWLSELILVGASVLAEHSVPISHERYIKECRHLKPNDLKRLFTLLAEHRLEIETILDHSVSRFHENRSPKYFLDLYSDVYDADYGISSFLEKACIFGLLSDEALIPQSYITSKGSAFSAKTLRDMVNRSCQSSNVPSLVTITNRGLADPDFVDLIQSDFCQPIVTSRVIDSCDTILNSDLLTSGFSECHNDSDETLLYKYKEIAFGTVEDSVFSYFNSCILYYSPSLFRIDRLNRDPLIMENYTINYVYLEQCDCSLVTPSLRHFKTLQKEQVARLPNPIFDGYRLIFTVDDEWTTEMVLKVYEDYRSASSYLTLLHNRLLDSIPWNPYHAEGARMFFMIALIAQTSLEYKLQKGGFTHSRSEVNVLISNALVTTVALLNDSLYFIKAKTHPEFDRICNILGVETLKSIETELTFSEKMSLSSSDIRYLKEICQEQ